MVSRTDQDPAGLRILVDGTVQGVGFRPWVHSLANHGAVAGRVWNDAGSVHIEAFGRHADLLEFVDALRYPPMTAAAVRSIRWQEIPHQTIGSFRIVTSRTGEASPAIPPDSSMCDACREELHDPSNRRAAHPFINCTECGPRYSISVGTPYDRQRTTMGAFEMCDQCRAEYEDVEDRRFHAQALACPQCGPQLGLIVADGRRVATGERALAEARDRIVNGEIVAIKGIGGYHLACDATSESAVAELRRRKARDAKPFAIMAANADQARQIAHIGRTELAALSDPARPIVLADRRHPAPLEIAEAVAPKHRQLGLMLPYAPLHELLIQAVGVPLVMTSANRCDEPMVTTDEDARDRLLGVIADAMLVHDRNIANRCDDSVVRVLRGAPTILRRGRGFVPSPIALPLNAATAVLACGAHLKNTFCYLRDDQAWLGPHVGDLETDLACRDFEAAVSRFGDFVGIEPAAIACDLHEDYFSTRFAVEQASRRGVPLVRVQHHHAHIAAAMVENGLTDRVLGLAWDGTGAGTDGTAWGGELLRADLTEYERLATFRPIPLAGGSRAIREVWRIALAVLDDAFDGAAPAHALARFEAVPAARIEAIRSMLVSRVNTPLAHGVGRWFDAFGALILGISEARYEGEVAIRLGHAAEAAEAEGLDATPFDFAIDESNATCAQVDLRSAVRQVVSELRRGADPGWTALRFHSTLGAAAERMLDRIDSGNERLPVILSGGCFQNPLLIDEVAERLETTRSVFVHRRVPTNDGGIALGQAAVAAARLTASGTPPTPREGDS